MKPRILLVDDEDAVQTAYVEYLKRAGYSIDAVATLKDAKQIVSQRVFHIVLLDLILPDGNGIDWIAELKQENPDVLVVVITGHGDIAGAVRAMRNGADHFLTKPIKLKALNSYLEKNKTLQRQLLQKRNSRSESSSCFYFGKSENGNKIKEMAELACRHFSPVLLLGETGTGKGVLAKYIHEQTFSEQAPFVAVNCSSLKSELLASELFGHKKGAFTSAIGDKKGLIEVADGGTLFLDEIVNMSIELQAEFLKVLDDKSFRPLGEVELRQSDFRLVCATNQDIEAAVEKGTFRQDLYYRINVFPIELAPLRQRKEDIPGLVTFFLKQLNSLHTDVSPELLNALRDYYWPGNIRELRNQLERALLIAGDRPLQPQHFPALMDRSAPSSADPDLGQMEQHHIRRILQQCNGDKELAAKKLGISLATLYRKLK